MAGTDEGQLLRVQRVSGLIKEADELTAIMFSAQRSARQKVLIPKS
jgi:hypothetical protein